MYPNIYAYKNIVGTTKDQIVNILSYEWPLSIRKIYFLLKKRYGIAVTYQAIYKAINEMLQEKIVVKTKEGYQLNLDWVKNIHDQTEMIRVNYFSKQQSVVFGKGEEEAIRTFIFKSWFDVEKYLYYLQKNYVLRSKEKQTICIHHSHEWRPLFYLRAEYNWAKTLRNLGHKTFILCSGNSILDKWCADFYKNISVKIKINAKVAETFELMVFSDLIVQSYIPFELKNSFDKECSKIKNIEELNRLSLIKNIFEKESEIKVIINKDSVLAKQIIKQTISKFKH